jgi:hypothetical protein
MDISTKIYLSCTVVAVISWLLIDQEHWPEKDSDWSKLETITVILSLYVVSWITVLTPAYVIYLIWR